MLNASFICFLTWNIQFCQSASGEKKKVYLHQNTALPINRHRSLQCKCLRKIWVVMMADIFSSKEESEGLQVQSAVLTWPNCTRAVRAPYQEKWSSCATWCLSAASCPHWASSWLMWCPAVIAGLVRSQTWTSSRECCVTVAPLMTDRVSDACSLALRCQCCSCSSVSRWL